MSALSHWRHNAALLLILVMLPAPLTAQTTQTQTQVCDDDRAAPAERRTACTAIIDNAATGPKERAEALVNRGDANGDDKDYDGAIADLTAALALNPKDAAAYVLRGNAYDAKGDLDKALADYNVAIGLDPNDATGYFNRAEVYQAKGDKDQAMADYKKALEIDGAHDGAKEGLAELTKR